MNMTQVFSIFMYQKLKAWPFHRRVFPTKMPSLIYVSTVTSFQFRNITDQTDAHKQYRNILLLTFYDFVHEPCNLNIRIFNFINSANCILESIIHQILIGKVPEFVCRWHETRTLLVTDNAILTYRNITSCQNHGG
jgi:hypothetical protein